ncbi:hypothetical protein [Aestuariispira insulae]|uniref:Uncharacterized protein n=1 Tax=Aestuariispira insulae TaxID=1461337 RepID=A0A3D9HVT8_9PROT|nr:hypothetical protein [Aestuariispira insulae]RED53550.1 hypothetical protein DFP90_101341 [Aestuariispira insulae]
MKYIIFNIVVAGALVYLVAGDDLQLPTSPTEAIENTEVRLDETINKIRPEVEKTASKVAEEVAEKVAARVADEIAARLEQERVSSLQIAARSTAPIAPGPDHVPAQADPVTAAMLDPEDTLYQDPAIGLPEETAIAETLPPIEEVQIAPVTTYKPIDGLEEAVGQSREMAGDFSPPTPDSIQIAEGEQMMAPRDRQRELDALAQNMEMMFLNRAGQ